MVQGGLIMTPFTMISSKDSLENHLDEAKVKAKEKER